MVLYHFFDFPNKKIQIAILFWKKLQTVTRFYFHCHCVNQILEQFEIS